MMVADCRSEPMDRFDGLRPQPLRAGELFLEVAGIGPDFFFLI
jgi:hypothetical protein